MEEIEVKVDSSILDFQLLGSVWKLRDTFMLVCGSLDGE